MRISDWSSDVCSSDLPGVERRGPGNRVLGPLAAFGAMFGGAILGDVDRLAREQRLALAGKILRLGERRERLHRRVRQMRLGPVEMQPRDVDRKPRHAILVLGEQRGESGRVERIDRAAVGLGHRGSRTEEHTSELQSLMRISYAVFCWQTTNN